MGSVGRVFRMSKERGDRVAGVLFTLPFTIGFLLFFLNPFVRTVQYSLSSLRIEATGYTLDWVGFSNYHHIFRVHAHFVQRLFETTRDTIVDTPLVLVFSLFAAMLLNQKFKGRVIARSIFFLPVIMGAGVILRYEQGDFLLRSLTESIEQVATFGNTALEGFLQQMGMHPAAIEFIVESSEKIPQIVRASGVQILVFLAGFQSIPKDLYEAASVEGCTAWEGFWMITIPWLSPVILANAVYTIIDSFTDVGNDLVWMIRDTAFRTGGFGQSAAMGIVYFLSISVILGVMVFAFNRYVFSAEKR